jgi:hypothetical protein
MFAMRSERMGLLVAAGGLVLVIAAQLLAGLTPVAADGLDTGRTLGQAGFVYLTGFRSTLAYLLWSRVDAVGDKYYANIDVSTMKYLLPTARIVTWLDPHYVDPYYVAQWVVARQGNPKLSLQMTKEALDSNPDSGLMRSSYAQLLVLYFGGKGAYDWALKTVAPDAKWLDVTEKFGGWAIARDVFKSVGDTARYEEAVKVMAGLQKKDATLAPGEKVGATK